MTEQISAGSRFRQALEVEKPLQIMGTVNAYAAMMAKQVGYKAIYLSGAGVANYSYGLPDLGMTSLDNVLEDVRRITERVDTPLLVLLRILFRTRLDVGSNQQNIRKFQQDGGLVFSYFVHQNICFGAVGFKLFGYKGRKE